MTRILLLAHKPLASALRDVATHVFPDCAGGVSAIDVDALTTPDALEALLRDRIEADRPEEVLILVDVFGATPCNAAMRVADGARVRVVAGVNVPMLWRTLCYRTEALSALVERALAGAVQGVMHVAETRRQNQSTPGGSTSNDQVQHSHQQ
jgi:PTS system mannose-specific IIA component